MVISRKPIRCKLEIEGAVIQQVMEFNYLDILINSYGITEKEEIEQQVSKVDCLNGTIWRN